MSTLFDADIARLIDLAHMEHADCDSDCEVLQVLHSIEQKARKPHVTLTVTLSHDDAEAFAALQYLGGSDALKRIAADCRSVLEKEKS